MSKKLSTTRKNRIKELVEDYVFVKSYPEKLYLQNELLEKFVWKKLKNEEEFEFFCEEHLKESYWMTTARNVVTILEAYNCRNLWTKKFLLNQYIYNAYDNVEGYTDVSLIKNVIKMLKTNEKRHEEHVNELYEYVENLITNLDPKLLREYKVKLMESKIGK